jgi:hypothetical protein
VPGKSFIEIPREDEGSASVVRAVRKGLLMPPKIRKAPESPKSVATTPVAAAPAPVIEPEPTLEVPSEEESSPKPKSKRKRTRR